MNLDNILNEKALNDFITFLIGLVVEAFPFVILGVLVSVLVGLFLKEEIIFKILPKNTFLSHFMLSITGILMPVCECGNVPVVRRFLNKNLDVSHAVTFLLAAPIVNPITFFTTLAAFPDDSEVAFIRVGVALLIANSFGLLLSLKKNQNEFLTEKFYKEVCTHEHDITKNRFSEGLNIFQKEFTTVFKMLIVGASIAALTRVLIPVEVITAIGNSLFLSVIAMMLVAFVISICANVDAFFAYAYSGSFTTGSLLSFLIFGPMIDMKMLTMLKATFTAKLLLLMTVYVALCSLLTGLVVNYLI